MYQNQSTRLNNLLLQAQQGKREAREQLAQWLYEEVQKKVASLLFKRHGIGHRGANGTASMIERSSMASKTMIKLLQGNTIERAEGIGYLRCAIATAAREVLIDAYRQYDRRKRNLAKTPPPDIPLFRQFDRDDLDVCDLHRTLEELEAIDARKGSVVTFKYFWGWTISEIANELRVSESTVEADWRLARAWLKQRLGS